LESSIGRRKKKEGRKKEEKVEGGVKWKWRKCGGRRDEVGGGRSRSRSRSRSRRSRRSRRRRGKREEKVMEGEWCLVFRR